MKPICVLLALLAVLCLLAAPVCANTVNDTDLPDLPLGGNTQKGDVNGDSKIDSTDARLTLQYFVGSVGASDLSIAAADINGDGEADSTDARLILQYFVGSISAFPKG